MAEAKEKYEVVHPRQYFKVGGKVQKVEKGTQIELTAVQAKKLGDRVLKVGGKKQAKVGETEPAKPAGR